ncbi:MAG: hypothetical protein WC455_23035 [Dehalococcoidia bacterium]|jgi:hypothetical protein
MKIRGYRAGRIIEWIRVLWAERVGPIGIARLAITGLSAIINGRLPPEIAKARYRICVRCPVFDPKLRRCRNIYDGEYLGCGCYMPFKVSANKPGEKCWARSGGENSKEGWE